MPFFFLRDALKIPYNGSKGGGLRCPPSKNSIFKDPLTLEVNMCLETREMVNPSGGGTKNLTPLLVQGEGGGFLCI